MIWITTFILVSESLDRLRNPKEINGKLMIIVALLGVIANVILFKILGGQHGHGHSHSSGSCQHAHGVSLAYRSAILHVIGKKINRGLDSIGWGCDRCYRY